MNKTIIKTGSIADYRSDIEAIRITVFVHEQKVPIEVEMDDRDTLCIHALAWVGSTAVATGRIDLEDGGKIGRIAVLADYRRQGLGKAVMETLEQIARDNGMTEVWLHAQLSALPFYEELGYQAQGEEFYEAGIPHLTMNKSLGSPSCTRP
jgi:predicted GNAT family N-acyltransferase